MRNKITVLFLILTLVLTMFGCSANPATTGIPGTSSNSPEGTTVIEEEIIGISFEKGNTANTDANPSIKKQLIPGEVENPDNLPVLKWVCFVDSSYGGSWERTWNSAAVQELNQMLAERNLPFRVQFLVLTSDTYIRDWFSSPSVRRALQDADLVYGKFSRDKMVEYLYPITEYATGESTPTLQNAVPHENSWLSTTINGAIYGIGTKPEFSRANGWQVNSEFMASCGLTAEDFSKNFWEMDDLFAEIYKKNGNQPFLFYDGMGYETSDVGGSILKALPLGGICDGIDYSCHQPIGASFSIDFTAQSPTVVNILETDLVRNIQKAYARYNRAGYTTSKYDLEKMRYDQVLTSVPCEDESYTYIPITKTLIDGFAGAPRVTGIAATSQHKDEGVSLLNLIAEDTAFQMQLFYGKEGRDYRIENGFYTLLEQNGETYSLDFLSPLAYFSGFVGTGDAISLSPSTSPIYRIHDGKTALESYRDDMENVSYCYYPISFDYSAFPTELEALGKVMAKYYTQFANLSNGSYDEMLLEMKDAGIHRIIDELQRQLDAWIAENPNWNPLT